MKKEINLILLILFLLCFLILSYLNYTVSQERQMFIANRLYSTWSVDLIETVEPEQLIEALPQNSRVFFEHTTNGNIRTFHQNGNWIPPMMAGYFFSKNTPRYSAVVGEHYVSNGETSIEIEGVSYEIIGVIGAGYPSVLDRLILLNTLPESMPIEGIVLDTRRSSEMEGIQQLFEIENRHTADTALEFLNNHELNEMIQQNVIIVMIILSFLLGYVYLVITEKRTTALRLVGWSRFKIVWKNSVELMVLSVLSFIPIFLIDTLFGHGIILAHWSLYGALLLLVLMGYQVNYLIKGVLKFGGERSD